MSVFFREIESTDILPSSSLIISNLSPNPINLFQDFLVVQWLRIHLQMQGAWVQSLVREDRTCCRTTKLMSFNY